MSLEYVKIIFLPHSKSYKYNKQIIFLYWNALLCPCSTARLFMLWETIHLIDKESEGMQGVSRFVRAEDHHYNYLIDNFRFLLFSYSNDLRIELFVIESIPFSSFVVWHSFTLFLLFIHFDIDYLMIVVIQGKDSEDIQNFCLCRDSWS